MIVNFGDNTWNLFASIYWLINSMVDPKEWLDPALTALYEHICTCQEDAFQTSLYLGAEAKPGDMLSSCSESAKNAKTELNKLRENKLRGEAEVQQKAASKLKVESNIKVYMEERWQHYMKQPEADLKNGYMKDGAPGKQV